MFQYEVVYSLQVIFTWMNFQIYIVWKTYKIILLSLNVGIIQLLLTKIKNQLIFNINNKNDKFLIKKLFNKRKNKV